MDLRLPSRVNITRQPDHTIGLLVEVGERGAALDLTAAEAEHIGTLLLQLARQPP